MGFYTHTPLAMDARKRGGHNLEAFLLSLSESSPKAQGQAVDGQRGDTLAVKHEELENGNTELVKVI